VLSADDPLPARPHRVLVAGVSGSGKTTLVRRIAGALDLPSIEMDALHHGPAWTPRPEFESDVQEFTRTDAWVCEWQYDSVRPLLADRADTLVWLDLPTPLVLSRIVRRTVRRRLRREVLWNDNREAPLHTFFTDREHIVRWFWRTRGLFRELVPALERTHPRLAVVRLGARSDVDRFVTRLSSGVA
jgi:adenylate kinase family enzyme